MWHQFTFIDLTQQQNLTLHTYLHTYITWTDYQYYHSYTHSHTSHYHSLIILFVICARTHTHYWLLISNRFKCNLGTSCAHRQTSTPDTTSSPSDRVKGGCGAPAPRCRLSDNFGIGHGHLRDGIFFLQSVCQTAVRLNQTNFYPKTWSYGASKGAGHNDHQRPHRLTPLQFHLRHT